MPGMFDDLKKELKPKKGMFDDLKEDLKSGKASPFAGAKASAGAKPRVGAFAGAKAKAEGGQEGRFGKGKVLPNVADTRRVDPQRTGGGGQEDAGFMRPNKLTAQDYINMSEETKQWLDKNLDPAVKLLFGHDLKGNLSLPAKLAKGAVTEPVDAVYDVGVALSRDATPEQRARAGANVFLKTGLPGAGQVVKAAAKPIAKAVGTTIARNTAKGAQEAAEAAEDVGATFRPRDPATVTDNIDVQFRPKASKAVPKQKGTTVSHEDTGELRKVLGMEDRASSVRPDSEVMKRAKNHDPFAVVSKVNRGEAATDAEQVAMGVRLQQLRKGLDEAKQQNDFQTWSERWSEAEELADALDKAGSEAGRAMRARRLLIDEHFDEFGLKRMIEKDQGKPLSVKQNKQIEQLVQSNKDLESQLGLAQKELAEMRAATTVKEASRRAPRFNKADLDAELDSILKEFNQATKKVGSQANDITQVIATLGAEGTKLVYKVAVNYAKRGINQIDDLVAAVQTHFPQLNREDIVDVIANAGAKHEPRTPSEIMKRIGDLRRQAKNQSPTRAAELQKQIDVLVQRMKDKDFTVDVKDVKLKSKQVEMLEAQRDITRKRFQALRKAAQDDSSHAWKAAKGVADAVRGVQLGFDLGAVFRQGLFGVSHPTKMIEALKGGFKSMRSDVALQAIENGINKKLINGKPAMAVRSKARLYMADSLSHGEEAFISGIIKKIPGLGKVYEGAERFTTGFLNTYRAEMFDWFAKNVPDASEQELKDWARWINSTSGRSNLQEIPKTAQIIFTSPRFAASRFEVIGRILQSANPLGNRASKQVFKEAVKTVGVIYGAMKMAEAAGAEVNFDPESSDFLKIRTGETVYDPTAGMSGTLRMLLRSTIPVLRQKPPAFLQDPASQAGKYIVQRASPFVSTTFSEVTGASLTGFEVPEDEQGWNALLPLIVAQAKKNIEKDGLAKGALKSLPELFGVGSNTYPKSPPKSVTKN